MVERFPDEFVTWHHPSPLGVKVDEVFGMDDKSGNVWRQLAMQIFCEQGEPNYRVIGHFDNGAPFIEGVKARISITHTSHFLAVASLPKTPEIDLASFNPRAAMGIDAEPLDRRQVINVRSKFLSDTELNMVPEDDLQTNIIAWTCKEALYKAALIPGLDFKNSIQLLKLPSLESDPVKANINSLGQAQIIFPEDSLWGIQPMKLFSYTSYNCCVTIAISPKANRFGK